MKQNSYRLFKYLFINKWKTVLLFILTLINSLLSVGLALITYEIIHVAQNGTSQDVIYLLIFVIGYLSFLALINTYENILKNKIIQNAMKQLKQDVLYSIMNQDYQMFSQQGFSNYYGMMTQDMEMIELNFFNGLNDMIYDISGFMIALTSMLYMNIYVTLWVFVMTFIVLKLPSLLNERFKSETEQMSNMNTTMNISIKDTIYSYGFSRNLKSRKNIILKSHKIIEQNCFQKIKLLKTKKMISILSNTTAWATSFTTSIICAYFVIQGQMSLASMLAFSQLMNNISYPLVSISEAYHGMKSLKPIIHKINVLLENEQEKNVQAITFDSSIDLKNVSYSYGENKIIDNISLCIEKGKKYLLLGESGSGKSTLLKLINRYYDCTSGVIELDQKNINKYSSMEMDQIMTLMNQDVYMMNDTLKNNITLLNDEYSEEELQNVIQVCGLKDLVEKLPNKENEMILEDGKNFSGGEKQRIALARTMIRKTPILLLDEFNSSLDEANSIEIERIILDMNITVINVSHKIHPANLMKYDKVLYLNHKHCKEIPLNQEGIKEIKQILLQE